MNLGTKINLMLVTITAVVLSLGFFISTRIDSGGIERQISTDATLTVGILRADIERTFVQAYLKQERLQMLVGDLSKFKGVTQISVMNEDGYLLAQKGAFPLSGRPVSGQEFILLAETIKGGKAVDRWNDKKTFYELERRTPLFFKTRRGSQGMVSMILVQVASRSKGDADVKEAQEVLRVVAASMEQNARSFVVDIREDIEVILGVLAKTKGIGFLHTVTVFDGNLNVLASNEKIDKTDQPKEHQQYREDVLTWKTNEGEYARTDKEQEVLVRVAPLSITSGGKTKRIGVLEAHISTVAYKDQIETLKMRLAAITVGFTVLIVVILAIVLRKKVTDPIKKYSAIAQRVANGDFDQTVDHTSSDEIGRFGDVFNSMLANLREFDRMKSGFLSVAAHQLRTPLSGIKWVFKLLLDEDLGKLGDDQRQMLKRGYETSEKMTELVNGLLDVSRIENGKFGYKFEENDIRRVLQMLVENSELACREHNINLRFNNQTHAIVPFIFDAEKLLMAFQNIVDNAIKYTLPGGSVAIAAGQQGNYLEVRVSDTGVGIPKDEIPKLFAKFFRAANVIHLQTEGSGLGLFIAKSIILHHGGQISVSSIEGKGTTFIMTVPLLEELLPKEGEERFRKGVIGLGHLGGTVI